MSSCVSNPYLPDMVKLKMVMTDNGPQFDTYEFAKDYNIKYITSSPGYQTNYWKMVLKS